MNKPVYVTRFNNETFEMNINYCNNYEAKECIYNTPVLFNNKTRDSDKIYVLEMNNSINKIVGIGMITPRSYTRKHKIYKDAHYNRYSYEGKYRISISECTDEIIKIVEELERVIFYTKGHIKRGHGIQNLPMNSYRICEDKCVPKNKGLYDYINELFVIKKCEPTRTDNITVNDHDIINDKPKQ